MHGSHFKLVSPRPRSSSDMSDEERAKMAEHAAYWTRVATAGRAPARGLVVRATLGFRTKLVPPLSLVTPTERYDGLCPDASRSEPR